MKKKLRTILKDTVRFRSKDLFYFSVILFLCTCILSMSLFFTGGDAIEKSLASSLDLTLSFKNIGYFASDSESTLFVNYPELNQKLSKMVIDDLEELSNDNDLAYANYTLAMDCYFQLKDYIPQTTTLYGLRDVAYLSRNSISLEECTEEDLITDTVLLPISDKEKGSQINDPYFISDPKDPAKIIKELKVAGFYKDTRWTGMNSDPISSYSPPITTNNTILSLLDSHPYFYGYFSQGDDYIYLNKLQISNIEFSTKDIDCYDRFIKKFNSFSMEENSKFARTCSEENAYDISVRRLLGEKEKNTVLFYIRYYLVPAIPAMIIGEPCGYACASFISKHLYQNSLRIQNEMSQLTGSSVQLDTISIFSSFSLSKVILISILISILMLFIICLATVITTIAHEKHSLQKQARGEQYE